MKSEISLQAENLEPQSQITSSVSMTEDFMIAYLVKIFELQPVICTNEAIKLIGDKRTTFYERQNPRSEYFDKSYPEPINKERSRNETRLYWTIDVLRWRIRNGKGPRLH